VKAPKHLYVLVCTEWTGTHYDKQNIGIYSDLDTATVAAESMQGNYKKSDVEYSVDEVEFCEVWK